MVERQKRKSHEGFEAAKREASGFEVLPGFEPRSEESESSVMTNYTNRPFT